MSNIKSVFLAVPALVLIACGGSPAPEATSVDEAITGDGSAVSSQPIATWEGGPMFASFPSMAPVPVQCTPGDDTLCDNFQFSLDDPNVQQMLVSITPDEGFEGDDTDLYVYDDQGNQLSGFTTNDGDANEQAVVPNTGSSFYEVRTLPWLVTPGHTFDGAVLPITGQPIDVERDCLELVPENVGVAGITDDGSTVELSVHLLLDNVDAAVAADLFARATESYDALGIDLVVSAMEAVQFTEITSDALIQESKVHTGGVPPNGADIVGLLTDKEMQSGAADGTTVIGQADCIGGIRFDENSYFVATDVRDIEESGADFGGTGLNPNVEAAVEVISHEIGHLMGAHHHYGNCTEGLTTTASDDDASPCTLMFPAVNFASLNFGVFSGSVVRGHAFEHAND